MLKLFHISAISDLFILYKQDLMPYQRWWFGEELQPRVRSRAANSVAFVCASAEVVLSLIISSTHECFLSLLSAAALSLSHPVFFLFFHRSPKHTGHILET